MNSSSSRRSIVTKITFLLRLLLYLCSFDINGNEDVDDKRAHLHHQLVLLCVKKKEEKKRFHHFVYDSYIISIFVYKHERQRQNYK